MLVCRICGVSTEYMWKCVPHFKETHPLSFGMCSKCMQIGLAMAYKILIKDIKEYFNKKEDAEYVPSQQQENIAPNA